MNDEFGLTFLIEDFDNFSSSYRDNYSKVSDRTNDFTKELGNIEFLNKADAEMAVSILQDKYSEVKLKEPEDEKYPFYFVYYSNIIEEKKKSDELSDFTPNFDLEATPLGNWSSFDAPVGEELEEDMEIKRYSDVVPKEDRKYWYFTTHGVGPGSIPKGVNVLEIKDGKNNKGTSGTFVCLDAVLNTDELKKYDMKEMKPTDESLTEDKKSYTKEEILAAAQRLCDYENKKLEGHEVTFIGYEVVPDEDGDKGYYVDWIARGGGGAEWWLFRFDGTVEYEYGYYDDQRYEHWDSIEEFEAEKYDDDDMDESLKEDLTQSANDANSICKYLDKNAPGLWYDLADYDEAPMGTSVVSIIVEGDWKHEHLYFKELIHKWAEESGRDIFKIDEKEIGESESDWYNSRYDIYITKDKESFDTLTSMRRLFANESLDESITSTCSVVDLETGDKFGAYEDVSYAKTKAYQYMYMFGNKEMAIVDTDTNELITKVSSKKSVSEDMFGMEDSYFSREQLDEFGEAVQDELGTTAQIYKVYWEPGNRLEVDWECMGYEETTAIKVDMRGIRTIRDLESKYALKVVDDIHERCEEFERDSFSDLYDDDVDESVEKHDTLNQKIFNGDELDPEVKDKLLEIVDRFKYNLEENDIKLDIKDVRIIGSNASYNYTDKSDIDLHIFADLSVYPDQEVLLQKVYDAYKALWNSKYDPVIRGHEVEIYVEPYTGD